MNHAATPLGIHQLRTGSKLRRPPASLDSARQPLSDPDGFGSRLPGLRVRPVRGSRRARNRSDSASEQNAASALSEIKPSALLQRGHANIQKFFDAMQGAVNLIDPNPNIMIAAGALRDCAPTNPSDATTTNKRSIGLGDAIHLETCLYLRDVLGVKDIIFQTFDNGKGKNWEGRCVPLLTFERWFPDTKAKPVIDVSGLPRQLPRATQSNLFTQGIAFTSVAGTGPITPPPGYKPS
jgi:hypothetical protein